jgi:hypothetical protein
MEVLLLLLVALACAGYSSAVAGSKGHDSGPWALGGFLFGPLAFLASLGLPDLKTRRYLRLLAEHQGIDENAAPPPPATPLGSDATANADEQRRRILGLK